jgi:hypothetical protein
MWDPCTRVEPLHVRTEGQKNRLARAIHADEGRDITRHGGGDAVGRPARTARCGWCESKSTSRATSLTRPGACGVGKQRGEGAEANNHACGYGWMTKLRSRGHTEWRKERYPT